MKNIRKWLRLSFKILVATGISFVLLELLLLAFNDSIFGDFLYVYDRDLGFRVRSYGTWGGIHSVNRFGFNDRDYPLERKPDTLRILILSDSFNWAGGLNANYTSILEKRFEEEFGDRRVEIINAGYSSTHTYEQLLLLQKFGLQYNPDLVILGFVAGNDFVSAQPWRKRIVYGGAFLDIDTRSDNYWEVLGQPVLLKSRLYLYLKERLIIYKRQLEAEREMERDKSLAPESPVPTVTMPTDFYLLLEFNRMQFAKLEKTAEFAPHRQHILDSLAAMQESLKQKEIGFMVAVFPDEFQVDPSLRQAVIERYRMNPSKYRWNHAQTLLRDFCGQRGIEFHDFLPAFEQAHGAGQRLYLPNDSHWNDAGNGLAARLLYEILAARTG